MIFPKALRAKRDLEKTLRGIKSDSGFQYDVAVKHPDDADGPQQAIELYVQWDGSGDNDDQPLQDTDEMVRFQVSGFVPRRLVNQDIPIDELAMIVDADIRVAALADPRRGGNALRTIFEDVSITDRLEDGDFAFIRFITCHVRYDEDNPYSE